jgi:hypothetical protein
MTATAASEVTRPRLSEGRGVGPNSKPNSDTVHGGCHVTGPALEHPWRGPAGGVQFGEARSHATSMVQVPVAAGPHRAIVRGASVFGPPLCHKGSKGTDSLKP